MSIVPASQSPFDRVIDALNQHGCRMRTQPNGSAMATCPAHDDRMPSLHVTQTETRVLLHCFAGCELDAVLDALRLRRRDLYADERILYEYPDRLVYRNPYDKTFFQAVRGTAERGRAALYHRDRITAGATVHLVEGEEDVHAVEAAGGIGTTAPQGASNFHLADVAPLAGTHVIAVVDRDEGGDKWAELVIEKVTPVAASLRLVQARTGKDFSDHRAAGGTLDDLLPYQSPEVAEEPPRSLLGSVRNGDYLTRSEFPDLSWVVPSVIPEGLTMLVGAPKVGKSWLAYALSLAAAKGGKVLGDQQVVGPRPVLHFALEDGDRRMQSRGRHINGGPTFPALFDYTLTVEPGRIVETVIEWLNLPKVINHPMPPLVVLDILAKVMPPSMYGETVYARDYRITSALQRAINTRPGAGMIVLHHDRKAGSEDFVDSISGTNGIAGAADTIIILTRRRVETAGLLQVTGREVEELEYAVELGDGRWTLQGDTLAEASFRARDVKITQGLGDAQAELAAYVSAHPEGVSVEDAAARLGIDAKDASKRLSRLVEQGRISRPVRGTYAP